MSESEIPNFYFLRTHGETIPKGVWFGDTPLPEDMQDALKGWYNDKTKFDVALVFAPGFQPRYGNKADYEYQAITDKGFDADQEYFNPDKNGTIAGCVLGQATLAKIFELAETPPVNAVRILTAQKGYAREIVRTIESNLEHREREKEKYKNKITQAVRCSYILKKYTKTPAP